MKTKYLIISLIFLSFSLFGQTDSTKIKLNLALGGNYTGGNFSLYSFYIKSSVSAEWKNNELNLSPNFQYSQIANDGVNFKLREREFYYNLSYTRRWNNFRVLAYNEAENSFLRKVNFRTSAGLGAGYKFIKTKSVELDLSEIILPELLFSNLGSNFDNIAIRLSTRLKFSYTFKNFKISSITIFQPSVYTLKNGDTWIRPADNINLRSLNNIEFTPFSWFSIGLGNEVIYQTYSSSIDATIRPVDYNFSVFFRFKN